MKYPITSNKFLLCAQKNVLCVWQVSMFHNLAKKNLGPTFHEAKRKVTDFNSTRSNPQNPKSEKN